MTTPDQFGVKLEEYAWSRRSSQRDAKPARRQSIETVLIPDAHRSVTMGCAEHFLMGMTTETRA